MKPWQLAKKWFMEKSPGASFEASLGDYLRDGYVWSGDDCFIMGKPTLWDGETMYSGGGVKKPNCWFVFLAAGENCLKEFLRKAPFTLKYVAWQRRGKSDYHVHEWKRYQRRVNKG
jgi:hypothetical protein